MRKSPRIIIRRDGISISSTNLDSVMPIRTWATNNACNPTRGEVKRSWVTGECPVDIQNRKKTRSRRPSNSRAREGNRRRILPLEGTRHRPQHQGREGIVRRQRGSSRDRKSRSIAQTELPRATFGDVGDQKKGWQCRRRTHLEWMIIRDTGLKKQLVLDVRVRVIPRTYWKIFWYLT